MAKIKIPPRVREALARRAEAERREVIQAEEAERRREAKRAREDAIRRKRLRPAIRVIESWARELARETEMPSEIAIGRLRTTDDGKAWLAHRAPAPWGVRYLDLWMASDPKEIEDFAAAIEDGSIWRRVR